MKMAGYLSEQMPLKICFKIQIGSGGIGPPQQNLA